MKEKKLSQGRKTEKSKVSSTMVPTKHTTIQLVGKIAGDTRLPGMDALANGSEI